MNSTTKQLIQALLLQATLALPFSAFSAEEATPEKSQDANGAAPKMGSDSKSRPRVFEAFDIPDYKVDEVLSSKMREELSILKRLSNTAAEPNRRADIYYRMAEILWLDERSAYFKKMEVYDKQFEAYMTGKTKVKPTAPVFKGDASFALYREIIKSAPNYPRMDEVLFLAGFHSAEIKSSDAEKYFQTLVKRYPQSRFKYDAYMELGQIAFEARKFDDAIAMFSTVAKSPNRLHNYALYKISWCQYNKSDIKGATQIMQQVVKTSKGVQKELELREEALKDLIVFFSDLGQIDEAIAYFTSIGEPLYARKALERLSNIYFDQARYDQAGETLRRLIALDPSHPDASKHHSKMIDCLEKNQKLDMAMREMQVFINRYNRGTPWYNTMTDGAAKEYSMNRSEAYARFLAKKHHELAQNLEKSNPQESARLTRLSIQFYQKYILQFSDNKNAYEMRYLYAELLYKTKQFDLAAEQYEAVIKANSKGPKLKDSLLGVTDCLRQLEEAQFKKLIAPQTPAIAANAPKNPTTGIAPASIQTKNYERLQMSSYAQRLINADTTFIAAFPKDELIPKFSYERGQLFYNYNHFDKAKPIFVEVIQKFPAHSVADDARHKILDIYNVEKDWVNLERYATEFLKVKSFATAENQKLLMDLIQASIFARAEDLQNKKLFVDAARTYERLFTTYPESKYADKAMYNAAINYMSGDNPDMALGLARKFQAKYPSSSERPKLIQLLATYFDSQMDFAKAAEQYESLVKANPKSELAPDALYNAGLYREHLKEYSSALANYEEYIKSYPKNKDASETYFARGLIFEKLKNVTKAIEVFKEFPQKYSQDKARIVEGYYRLGKNYEKVRKLDEATTSFQRASGLGKKYKVANYYTAKADFELLQPKFDEFIAIKLKMPQQALMNAMDKKASLLNQLKTRYLAIINVGDAEVGVAALHHIGFLFQDFSQALFKAPVPKGLSPEQEAQYQQVLADRAAPIEKQAIEAYEKALQKAFELQVYNEWTLKSYDSLSEYKPDQYPPRQAQVMISKYVADPFSTFDAKAGELIKGVAVNATEFKDLENTTAQNGFGLRKLIEKNEGAVTANPRNVEGYISLGRAYRQIGDEEKSLTSFDNATLIKADSPELIEEFARNQLAMGEPSKAVSSFADLMRVLPKNWIVRHEWAIASRKNGNINQALEVIRKMLQADKNNLYAINNLGLLYLDTKKFELAQLVLEKAKKINPSHAGTLNNLGMTYLALDMYAPAQREFKAATEANPKALQPWLNLGAIYTKHGHYTEAARVYERALEIDPMNLAANLNLSAAYLANKQYDKASDAANKLSDANPNMGAALYNSGLAYLQGKDGEKAYESFSKYINAMGSKIGKNHPAYSYLQQAKNLPRKDAPTPTPVPLAVQKTPEASAPMKQAVPAKKPVAPKQGGKK